jgi:hypothetical protein
LRSNSLTRFLFLFSFYYFILFYFFVADEEEERNNFKDLVPVGTLKWPKARALAEVPRYMEKAPKIVNVKVSPRTIQQPR